MERIPDLDTLSDYDSSLNELIVDGFMHKSTTSSDAALPGITEDAGCLSHSEFELCVFEHDVSRLTSKLQCYPLKILLVGVLHDLITNLSGAREGNLIHLWMMS